MSLCGWLVKVFVAQLSDLALESFLDGNDCAMYNKDICLFLKTFRKNDFIIESLVFFFNNFFKELN